jgi:beta-carotene 15,15'-dioxygenase
MLRGLLLLIGLLLTASQLLLLHMDEQTQFTIFFVGILVLGIPHGAADLLVANQNQVLEKKPLSTFLFLVNYVGRLLLFALLLWLFPVAGIILFLLFAAYHFGETDMFHFRTDTWAGKLLVLSYGALILSVILMPHYSEVKQIFYLFPSGKANALLIENIGHWGFSAITLCLCLFIISIVYYCYRNRDVSVAIMMKNILQLTVILPILYHLPMLLGFSFYFVFWHSILSLKNIVEYLRRSQQNTYRNILKQVAFYSALALIGIFAFGAMGFMFINNTAITAYLFLGLAVLTAPHMEVMHTMYRRIRAIN